MVPQNLFGSSVNSDSDRFNQYIKIYSVNLFG